MWSVPVGMSFVFYMSGCLVVKAVMKLNIAGKEGSGLSNPFSERYLSLLLLGVRAVSR